MDGFARCVPTVRDRVVQTAAKLILEPIFEADFLDSSFGFRPGRSAHQAIDAIRQYLASGRNDIYDADLKGYFDTIPHDQLLKAVGMRVADRQVMSLLQMWLTSVVEETDERGRTQRTRPRQGTPQGGVISPLLANIYLHWFEVLFNKPDGPGTWANARIVRYADDFVIMARHQGVRLREWIEKTLEGRFRLTINREKTRVVRLTEPRATLSFLGFTLRYEWDRFGRLKKYLRQEPSAKAEAKVRDTIRDLTGPKRGWQPVAMMIATVNQTIRGWKTYFRPGHPNRVFYRLDGHLLIRFWRPYTAEVSVSIASPRTSNLTPTCNASACSSSNRGHRLRLPTGDSYWGSRMREICQSGLTRGAVNPMREPPLLYR
jgi:RNA-directed DNA polymerase